jgi:AcrR family transcriptional regulator
MDSILHRKDRLIISTIDLLDKLGIQGLSTREIAKLEEVSEATLFRHYKNKNDLLIAVLDYFSQFDADLFQTAKMKNLGPKEAILFLINSTVEYYENYPAITAITQLFDILRYEPDLTDKVNSIMNNYNAHIREFVLEAQNSGTLISADPDSIVAMISGLCRENCLRWRLEGKCFLLKERTMSSLKILLDALSS